MSTPFARIVSMHLLRESLDSAFDYFRDVSSPLIREQPGSIGILGAGNGESGLSCSISFWDDLDSLERSNSLPRVVDAMGGYAKWMAGAFRVESYSVVQGSVPEPQPDTLPGNWMRMTSVAIAPERLDEVLATYESRLAAAHLSSSAITHSMLLAPQIGSRVLAIEFWTSRTALGSWDAAAKLEDQRLFRLRTVEQPPERDLFEVFGYY